MFLEVEAIKPELFPILIAVVAIMIPVLVLLLIVTIKFVIKRVSKNKEYNNAIFKSSDYKKLFGGEENILNIEVVMTRVNITVKQIDLVEIESLKSLGIGILISGNVIKCSSSDFASEVEKTLKK